MAETPLRLRTPWLVAALLLPALALCLYNLGRILPPAEWWEAVTGGQGADGSMEMGRLLFVYSALPRAVMALACGAALGLSGALMQRVLRNPIASPFTLGVSAGAQLALAVALLYAPSLIGLYREAVALAGGLAAMVLVLALSWRHSLAPVTVVLAGMIISLTASAVSAALILANGEYLMSLFIWGGGSLSQQGWAGTLDLLPRLLIAALAVLLLLRPLTILGLDDSSARNLGLALQPMRLLILLVAVWLAASVVATLGVIGFVGLAAPAFARLTGARTSRQVLLWSPCVGAGLLWLTDTVVQLAASAQQEFIPTGAVTALLGGPLLLWLLPRLRLAGQPAGQDKQVAGRAFRKAAPRRILLGLALCLPLVVVLGLSLGRDPSGWFWAQGALFMDFLEWRAPRLVAALCAGAMLAAAGTILQRLTGNPMASPEVLGVSSGAGLGLALLLLTTGAADPLSRLLATGIGAALAIAAVLLFARRDAFSPERLLLAGIALGAFCSAALSAIMASGEPRAFELLAWLMGSTHEVGGGDALATAIIAALLLPLVPLAARWLEILPLGTPTARALGLSLIASRLALVVLAALLTAAATLVVGPLSFVGLMAPHGARMAGLTRALPQLLGAILLGAILMALADWGARSLAFPYQLPVGLFATLVGGPYLMWLLSCPQGTRRPV